MSQYHALSPKREKRRQQREKELGPERRIVSTTGEAHVLECGHRVLRASDELPHIKRRRCAHCRTPTAVELNRTFRYVPEAWRPLFCEECGAQNSMVGEAGDRECRECLAPWKEPT